MTLSRNETKERLLAAAHMRLERLQRASCFDPAFPDSRPTHMQQLLFDDFGTVKTQWVVAANQSGKTQAGSRLISWVVTETHPTWTRPAEWNDEPLLVLVLGRTGKQIEDSLWTKIKSYLEPGTYKENRPGGLLQRVDIVDGPGKGNRIVFQSVESSNQAAERIQSYVAHLVVVDEMPPTLKILSEAMVRRNSRDGYFLGTFTPLVINDSIRQLVDSADGVLSRKYKFLMFDNPVYADPERQQEVLDSMRTLSEHERNTRLYGEWAQADNSVYYFSRSEMVRDPVGYSTSWRHVESVDPALKSALGLTLWAEDPATGFWYCIKSEYIRGIHVPTELVAEVQRRVAGVNIVRRVCDPANPFYTSTAQAHFGLKYICPYSKNNRKGELIKSYQQALGRKIFYTSESIDIIRETETCRWSDQADQKIVNARSYHLLDSAQYFVDCMPKMEPLAVNVPWAQRVREEHYKFKKREEAAKKKGLRIMQRRPWTGLARS